ncbi:MAG: glycerophosphodiester phosphodiesterase [Saprospiraceae bacterium]|nr:glycerophosphodiester phosphodiesterase [Saprospiraceae bacterium]
MKWIYILSLLTIQKCNPAMTPDLKKPIDIQGHRGCRGLMPENSIPAFLKGLELGVNTLELDVVISGDGEVVVSHEPFFSHEISKDPLGRSISKEDERSHNIFQMNVSDIQQYDCGSKIVSRFPDQLKIKTYKPTLREVFDHVEKWISDNGLLKVFYNIEIKRIPDYDGIFHPGPDEYANQVFSVIDEFSLRDRVIIQSFDPESLEVVHRLSPTTRIAFLVEAGDYESNMKLLSFKPDIYSPDFSLLTKDLIKKVVKDQIAIIPWTINDRNDIIKALEMGVDGIISDYPDRVIAIRDSLVKL